MPGLAPMQNAFRRQLRQELAAWQEEGLVSADLNATLTERYALNDIEDRASISIFVVTIYLIGAVLIGGGIISLIAANWSLIPVPLKVGGLLALLIAGHGVGFLYHRRERPFIAECAFLTTAFIYGACIGLFAQIFHLQGHFSTGFGLWAAGVTALALATGSVPVAHVAIVASLVSYTGKLNLYDAGQPLWYLPLLAVLGFGFARWRRSPHTELSVLLALGFALLLTAGYSSRQSSNETLLTSVFFCVLCLGLGGLPRPIFGAKSLGILASIAVIYVMSFNNSIGSLERTAGDRSLYDLLVSSPVPPTLVLFAALAWFVRVTRNTVKPMPSLVESVVLAGLVATLVAWTLNLSEAGVLLTNLALAGIAAALLWKGAASARRWVYWGGLSLTALVITTRFLEYDTGLLAKAVVFLTCGIGLVFASLSFERRLKEQGILR